MATQSVPAAGIVAAAAAAAAAATAGGSKGAGVPSQGGNSNATGSTGNLMSILRSSVGIARGSGRSGKVFGRPVTSEDEDQQSDTTSRLSDYGGAKGGSNLGLGKPSVLGGGGSVQEMCDADLADARSWLVTGE